MQVPGSPSPPAPSGPTVLVIGAGLVGLCCGWLLSRRGHRVLLLDGHGGPDPASVDALSGQGSEAALGVLMARVFHRSSGRGWRLRQRSLELWGAWRQELATRQRTIPRRPGLLLLAADGRDLERQRALLEDPRRRWGDPREQLQHWGSERLRTLEPAVPAAARGGLYSPADGQLDPLAAMEALGEDGAQAGMERRSGWATALERKGQGWQVHLAGGEHLQAEWVVLAAGLGSAALLAGEHLLQPPRLEPVLGQALELELDPRDRPASDHWPGSVVWRGVNLIQRPPACGTEAGGPWRLWLGATLEPGATASAETLETMRHLDGAAPDWLGRARRRRQWQGLRARPVGQPAPLLQELDAGLLLAAGHYRNGVLLAPASAEWVVGRIEAGRDAA